MNEAYLDENYLPRRESLFRVKLTARTTVSGKYVYTGKEMVPDPTSAGALAAANPGRSFTPTSAPLYEMNNISVDVTGEPVVWARFRSMEGGMSTYEFDASSNTVDAARNVAGRINTANNQVFGLGSKVFAASTTAVPSSRSDLLVYVGGSLPSGFVSPAQFVGPGLLSPVNVALDGGLVVHGYSVGGVTSASQPNWDGFAVSEFSFTSGATFRELVYSNVHNVIACVKRDASGLVVGRSSPPDEIAPYDDPAFAAYGFAIVNSSVGVTRGANGAFLGNSVVTGGIITDLGTYGLSTTGNLPGGGYVRSGVVDLLPSAGVSGTFTTVDGKTVTVYYGVITSIV